MFSRKFYFAAVSTKEFKAVLAEDQNLLFGTVLTS